MKKQTIFRINQTGMASIMFALFFVLIVSLIATGFAVLVRNDQRQTLDKTLSYQAQYAAETAINRVQSYVRNNPNSSNSNCDSNIAAIGAVPGELDPSSVGVQITCLKWDQSVDKLYSNGIGASPVSFKINSDTGSTINTLKIDWEPVNISSTTINSLSTSSLDLRLNNFPTLRIVFGDADNINNSKTFYINPSLGPNANISSGNANGSIVQASTCSGGVCSVVINSLNWNPYGYIAISSLNGESNINEITAYSGNTTNNSDKLNLIGAQIEVDATARAQDVVKRLKVRIPVSGTKLRAGYSVLTDKLCKDYRLEGTLNDESVTGKGVCP
jgi:Tfp pilus assembly protein PilX